jgi:hypothetical protein
LGTSESKPPALAKGKKIEALGCKGICVSNKGVLHPTKLREIPNWG